MAWNLDKDRPICPQICESISVKIAKGEYLPNEKIPSVREIAIEAGVNPNTVQKAYVLLEEKGLICSLPKKGAFVTYSGDASGKNVSAKTITNNVLNAAAKKDAICVLMHDIAVKTTTADALPEIIEGLRDMGYRFEALTTASPVFHMKVNN